MTSPAWSRKRRTVRELLGLPAAVVLLTAVAAGFASGAHRGRPAELAVIGVGVALASLGGWPLSGHLAIATTAVFLILEVHYGRLTGGHYGLPVTYAVLIVVATLLAGTVRSRRRRAQGRSAPQTSQQAAARAQPAVEAASGTGPGTLAYELLRARRHERPLSLLVARPDDIEGLARRGQGDIGPLLEAVGRAVAESLRGTDITARRGENDFWIVLPETPSAAARIVAERIRLSVGVRQAELAPEGVAGLSISIGTAAFPDDGTEAATLAGAAQRALEWAIQLGGNRTVMHSVPPGVPAGWGLTRGDEPLDA